MARVAEEMTSRTAAELRSVAVDVLDRRLVAQGNFLWRDAEDSRQPAALFRAGCVTIVDNRLNNAAVQVRCLNKLAQPDRAMCHPLGDRFLS